jgi:hypothetical protein
MLSKTTSIEKSFKLRLPQSQKAIGIALRQLAKNRKRNSIPLLVSRKNTKSKDLTP